MSGVGTSDVLLLTALYVDMEGTRALEALFPILLSHSRCGWMPLTVRTCCSIIEKIVAQISTILSRR
jgi:hypothetical protein